MSNSNGKNLDFLFHPRSIALVGITIANPEHWTRTFLTSLKEFKYDGDLFLVNPKGGKIGEQQVYPRLSDVPGNVDYVIGLVPVQAAPALVDECAQKGVKAIHFCTAGFAETAEEEGIKLQAEVVKASQRTGIRIIGPNCMGLYCPEGRISFGEYFPKESGPVGAISQSGGNANFLVRQAMQRGIRFSKLISYGNACDLNESDYLEYLASDPNTKIILMYIEGVKDGRRFRRALEAAAKEKPVILLKGGLSEGGARAAAGHTASLAGSQTAWDALCKQLGIIHVYSTDELLDVLVTLQFMPTPTGRNVALIGSGGGASVLIADEFERRGLKVPQLPSEIINELRKFTPLAGNILRNPLDCTQNSLSSEGMKKAAGMLARWPDSDFVIKFSRAGQFPRKSDILKQQNRIDWIYDRGDSLKPMGVVLESSLKPEEANAAYDITQKCVQAQLPVYYSFAGAANAINLVISHYEQRARRQAM